MKNKLRKIIIDNSEYLYSIVNKYHRASQSNTLTLRIYLSGHKQTHLVVEFKTIDDYIIGQPLNSGIRLTNRLTNTVDTVNLNEPGYIRKFILQGQRKGWTGVNKMEKQNGLYYLNELGYDTDPVKIVDL